MEYTDYKQAHTEGYFIDPTKVTRIALQAAGSVAGLMITTEAMVSDMPEENAGGMPPGMPPGMDGMGGMM